MTASLSSILNIANSGLQVAQTGLNTVSNNIANANTAGYVREIVNQSAVKSSLQTMPRRPSSPTLK